MTPLWMTIAAILLLHTAWSIAHAIVNKGRFTEGYLTPNRTLPFLWGAVSILAIVQIAYFTLFT